MPLEHYVTILDQAFAPLGLALHHSLTRHGADFRLWVICVDHQSFALLQGLEIPSLRPLDVIALETDDLRRVKASRSLTEYCWTLSSWSISWIFDLEPSASRVTYIDSDLYFVNSPSPLFNELEESAKSVLITSHAYSPEYDNTSRSGRFCVQFMTFVREYSRPVLSWWCEQVLMCCTQTAKDGFYGDQKYIEEFPKLFPAEVHILQQDHLAVAPWNSTRFPVSDAVFYHFHGARLMSDKSLLLSGVYPIPRAILDEIYKPYHAVILQMCDLIISRGYPFVPQVRGRVPVLKFKRIMLRLKYQFQRVFDLFTVSVCA